MKNFIKNTRGDFFGRDNIIQPLKPKVYTVVVIYHDGYSKEYQAIEHPWKYISKVKKNPAVKSAYVK